MVVRRGGTCVCGSGSREVMAGRADGRVSRSGGSGGLTLVVVDDVRGKVERYEGDYYG